MMMQRQLIQTDFLSKEILEWELLYFILELHLKMGLYSFIEVWQELKKDGLQQDLQNIQEVLQQAYWFENEQTRILQMQQGQALIILYIGMERYY